MDVKIAPFKCEKAIAQADKGVVPGHTGSARIQGRQCGYRARLPSLGRPLLPLFCVGLVGEVWKVGVGCRGMALFADHSGWTGFSFGNQCPMREEECCWLSVLLQTLTFRKQVDVIAYIWLPNMKHLFPQLDDGLTWISPVGDGGKWPCLVNLGFDLGISGPPPQAMEDLKMMVSLSMCPRRHLGHLCFCIFIVFLFLLGKKDHSPWFCTFYHEIAPTCQAAWKEYVFILWVHVAVCEMMICLWVWALD